MCTKKKFIFKTLIGLWIAGSAHTYGYAYDYVSETNGYQPSENDQPSENIEMVSCSCSRDYSTFGCDQDRVEFLLRGDLLLWESKLAGLEGAFGTTHIEERDNGAGAIVTTFTEVDQNPDFKWHLGFRIGIDILYNCFGLELDWTHIHGGADYSKMDQYGRWKLRYDTIDLIFGRKFYPCTRFYFKPYVGVRGARIRQTLNSYLSTTLIKETQTTFPTILMDQKENFLGIGPQVGVEAKWYLNRNFSLYGDVDFVNYYGYVDGHYDHTDTFQDTIYVSKWAKRRSYNCPGMGGEVGIRWDAYSASPRCLTHFMVKLGVEQHRICDISELGADGGLTLAGGVFEAGLGFRF